MTPSQDMAPHCDAWLIQLYSYNNMWVFISPVHTVMSIDLTRQFKTEGFICPHNVRKQVWLFNQLFAHYLRTVVYGLGHSPEGHATVYDGTTYGASDTVMMSSGYPAPESLVTWTSLDCLQM